MGTDKKNLPDVREQSVDRFLETLAKTPPVKVGGETTRLIFALDATMSRQPTWDMATALQAEMFKAVDDIGGLEVQLVWFRGLGEFRASRWTKNAEELARAMAGVRCMGGLTQTERVLRHIEREAKKSKDARIKAAVLIGDAFEEHPDRVVTRAGKIGLLGVPLFIFQEGYDPVAKPVFQDMARVTKGAWCPFDQGSAAQLKALLTAVAAYASGGFTALSNLKDQKDQVMAQAAGYLTNQMKGTG